MSAASLSTISTLLRQDILPVIQTEWFMETALLDVLKKRGNATVQKLQNNSFEIVAESGRHSGVYTAGENDTLSSGKPKFQKMTVAPKYTYGDSYFTHQMLKMCEGSESSLVDVVTQFGKSVKESMAKDINRQFFGFGEGILTLVNGAGQTGVTQIIVDSTENIDPDMNLLIGTKSQIEAGTADAVTVVSVDSNTTFTVGGAVTVADNDRVVKAGVYSNSAYNDMIGLQGLVDYAGGNTTTFQGITRATNNWVNSYADVTSEALSVADMTLAILSARGGSPDAAFANLTLYNKYSALLATQKRLVNTIELIDGFQGLEIAAKGKPLPLVLDYDCPEGEVYFIDSSKYKIGEVEPMNWLDEGEGILKWVQNKAAYVAIMYYYAQLMSSNPRASSVLRNKTA